MSEAIILSLIGGAVSVVVAWMAARQETARQLVRLEVKMDLLWEVYVKDAVKSARTAGLAARNSPVALTPRWDGLLSEPLRQKLEEDLRYYHQRLGTAYDAVIETYLANKPALEALAEEHDLRLQAVIGALYIMAKEL